MPFGKNRKLTTRAKKTKVVIVHLHETALYTRTHTDYPLTVCDRFHGETTHTPNDASTMSYSDVFTVYSCELAQSTTTLRRRGCALRVRWRGLALARLSRKFFQNLRYGRERPKVARKLRGERGRRSNGPLWKLITSLTLLLLLTLQQNKASKTGRKCGGAHGARTY